MVHGGMDRRHRITTAVLALIVGILAVPEVSQAREGPVIRDFRPEPCPVAQDLPTRRAVDCGVLLVPQVRDRTVPVKLIEVAVAIVRAPDPRRDPIVFLTGGPDFTVMNPFSIDYFKGAAYAKHRDVIMVDARGVGQSRPRLACPEYDELEAAVFPERPTPHQSGIASKACRDRLVADGIEPSAYGAADVALDVRDLRIALGIEQWNLVAFSAGGEAGLELMRLDPAGIRAVVLDSVITRALDPTIEWVLHQQRRVDAALRGCRRQPSCANAFPDVGRRVYAEVRRLDRHPITFEVPYAGGGTITWVVDGTFILEELRSVSENPFDVRFLPVLADFFADGGIREYLEEVFLDEPFPVADFLALGRTYASRCRDDHAFLTTAEIEDAIEKEPLIERTVRFDVRFWDAVCSAWDVGRSDPAGRGYLDSHLPVLSLRGEWDGEVSNARIAGQARQFANGWLHTFPARGHAQLIDFGDGGAECARSITADFLRRPGQEPDGSCIDAMPRTRFATRPPVSAVAADGDFHRWTERTVRPTELFSSGATPR
jgi:pimeloyl-ACP methyl ester carboxylesterase